MFSLVQNTKVPDSSGVEYVTQGQAEDFPSVLELAYSLPTPDDSELAAAVSQLPGNAAAPPPAEPMLSSAFFQQATTLSPSQREEDRRICMFALSACMAPVASQELDAPPSSPTSSPFAFDGAAAERSFQESGMITPQPSTPSAAHTAQLQTAAFGSPFKASEPSPAPKPSTPYRNLCTHASYATASQPSAIRALTESLQLLSTRTEAHTEDSLYDIDTRDLSASPRSPPFRILHRRQGIMSGDMLRAKVGRRRKEERERFYTEGDSDGTFSDDDDSRYRPREEAMRHDRSRSGEF